MLQVFKTLRYKILFQTLKRVNQHINARNLITAMKLEFYISIACLQARYKYFKLSTFFVRHFNQPKTAWFPYKAFCGNGYDDFTCGLTSKTVRNYTRDLFLNLVCSENFITKKGFQHSQTPTYHHVLILRSLLVSLPITLHHFPYH